MSKKLQLKDLLAKVEWVQIVNVRGGWRLPDDRMTIGFYKANAKAETANEVRIRIGKDIIKKLKWKAGDKIIPCYHPDDLFSFMIFKSETGKGYTLGAESGTSVHKFSFRWDRPIRINECKAREVEFIINKDHHLIFRMDDTGLSHDSRL